MKKKLSKILGVGLSLVLVLALAVPVMADVTQPIVDVDPDEISAQASYEIVFKVNEDLTAGTDTITVVFPDGTDASFIDDTTGEVRIQSSVGTWGGSVNNLQDVLAADVATDSDKVTVVISLNAGLNDILEGTNVKLVIGDGTAGNSVVNPDEPDDYTLEVKTSEETDLVASASYEIAVPTVGGGIYVYNASMILVDTYGGSTAIMLAHTAGYFDRDDFIIRVEPGTYELTADIDIDADDLTFKSTDGAAETIIDARDSSLNRWTIIIDGGAEGVTIDGFTIDDADEAISIEATAIDAVVQNCVITDATVYGIDIDADDATVSDNVIEDCAIGIFVDNVEDTVISDNEITEASAVGAIWLDGGSTDTHITGNTITLNENSGIYFDSGAACVDTLIEGNTITANDENGIHIETTTDPTLLVISGNDITDNDQEGIWIEDGWTTATDIIIYNNIYGNTSDNLQLETTDDVTAILNWWGSAVESDITDELNEVTTTGDITYEPWLTDTQEDAFVGTNVIANDDDLDAEDEAGVVVATVGVVGVIAAAQYAANPQAAIDDALAFYDVYVSGGSPTSVTIKLYAGDSDTEAHVWSTDTDKWIECSAYAFSSFGGYVYVTVTITSTPTLDQLEGTAFALVAGTPDAPETLALTAPTPGDDDVPITNIGFTWESHAEATIYEVVLSAKYDLSYPILTVSLVGTAFTFPGKLDYSTPYYWQVTGLKDGDVEGKSDMGTFTTVEEPVEPPPPPAPEYTCPVDGFVFSTQEALADHYAAYHIPPPPVPEYTCPVDGYVFSTQDALAEHYAKYHPPVPPPAPEVTPAITGTARARTSTSDRPTPRILDNFFFINL